MKVFLTGGTGFTGPALAGNLLTRGRTVTALVHKTGSAQEQAFARMGSRLAAGNVTERGSMRHAVRGCE